MKYEYQILLFYKYVHIENPEEVRIWLFNLCQKLGLKGRLIVATEGLNITLKVRQRTLKCLLMNLKKITGF
jgi:UPF0176 protein